jgi:hypothetical protein
MRAAHPGNDAEAAGMIAALGDLQIREMIWSQPEARRREIGDENRARGYVQNRGGVLAERR